LTANIMFCERMKETYTIPLCRSYTASGLKHGSQIEQMNFYDLSQLPFHERYRFVVDYIASNSERPPDVELVYGIFEDTIQWFREPSTQTDLNLIDKLNDTREDLPPFFTTIYGIMEKARIRNLSGNDRLRIFDEFKEGWCGRYNEFRRIADIMEDFRTNEMLLEYTKKSPPPSILQGAVDVYKKCISFKAKLTKQVLANLRWHPQTPLIHYHGVQYCIDENAVLRFLHEFQAWNVRACDLWNDVFYTNQDFLHDSGYTNDWRFIVEHPAVLKEKADAIDALHTKSMSLLDEGRRLVAKHDEAISLEYSANAVEMSLYEREQEIAAMGCSEDASDEQYCYVYTLGCELFVFYVGIAADPRERFEQHIRGAFSDEAHLFKSKFIQKYRDEVVMKIVHEGTRRECRLFEKEYIAKHSPLGNMTEGGEG